MDDSQFYFIDFDLRDLLESEGIPVEQLSQESQSKRSRLEEIFGTAELPPNHLKEVVKNGETPLEDILGALSIGDDEKDRIRAEASSATGNYYNPDNPETVVKCYYGVANNWGPGVRVCRLVHNPNSVPDS
jgi:hypothetical protein